MKTPKQTVEAFWRAMGTNDFNKAAALLTEDYENYMPQTNEVIKGRENFALVNGEYPANGKWRFVINAIVVEGDTVVTDVSVTDSVIQAKVISFHTVKGELIHRQKEYWPDDYEAPIWRKQWVELKL